MGHVETQQQAWKKEDMTDFCPPQEMTSCSAGSRGAAPPGANGKQG